MPTLALLWSSFFHFPIHIELWLAVISSVLLFFDRRKGSKAFVCPALLIILAILSELIISAFACNLRPTAAAHPEICCWIAIFSPVLSAIIFFIGRGSEAAKVNIFTAGQRIRIIIEQKDGFNSVYDYNLSDIDDRDYREIREISQEFAETQLHYQKLLGRICN